jgi:hypothetical protein
LPSVSALFCKNRLIWSVADGLSRSVSKSAFYSVRS